MNVSVPAPNLIQLTLSAAEADMVARVFNNATWKYLGTQERVAVLLCAREIRDRLETVVQVKQPQGATR